MTYLNTVLMIIILYLDIINSNNIVFKIRTADSKKIVLKLRRTDNYELLYNFENHTTFYTKHKIY